MTKNQSFNTGDRRSLNYERASTIINMDREAAAGTHFHQRSMMDRENSRGAESQNNLAVNNGKQVKKDADLTGSVKLRKDLESTGSMRLRKHESISEKHRSATLDVLNPNSEGMYKFEESGNYGLAISGSETIKRHYQTMIRKYEAVKEEYDSLHKRYSDLCSAHSAAVCKLELIQEEDRRLRKR